MSQSNCAPVARVGRASIRPAVVRLVGNFRPGWLPADAGAWRSGRCASANRRLVLEQLSRADTLAAAPSEVPCIEPPRGCGKPVDLDDPTPAASSRAIRAGVPFWRRPVVNGIADVRENLTPRFVTSRRHESREAGRRITESPCRRDTPRWPTYASTFRAFRP